jgi:hypothetical protein
MPHLAIIDWHNLPLTAQGIAKIKKLPRHHP